MPIDGLRQSQSNPLETTRFRLELCPGAPIFEPSDASSSAHPRLIWFLSWERTCGVSDLVYTVHPGLTPGPASRLGATRSGGSLALEGTQGYALY